MIVAVGVDSVAIARIHRLWQQGGGRFLARVFTEREQQYCIGRANTAESLAARFCAKEAAMKCLRTGWGDGVGFTQIEVVRDGAGAVTLAVTGRAAAAAQQLRIRTLHVSLTHTADTATAFVIAED